MDHCLLRSLAYLQGWRRFIDPRSPPPPPRSPPFPSPMQDGDHRLSRERDLQLLCRLLKQVVQAGLREGQII